MGLLLPTEWALALLLLYALLLSGPQAVPRANQAEVEAIGAALDALSARRVEAAPDYIGLPCIQVVASLAESADQLVHSFYFFNLPQRIKCWYTVAAPLAKLARRTTATPTAC